MKVVFYAVNEACYNHYVTIGANNMFITFTNPEFSLIV